MCILEDENGGWGGGMVVMMMSMMAFCGDRLGQGVGFWEDRAGGIYYNPYIQQMPSLKT